MRNKLLAIFLMGTMTTFGQRQEYQLDSWEFSRDSVEWQSVRVPHDWAISGPFDKKWDLQRVAITQNGETEATEKSGRSGALPWIGKGYYRATLDLPSDCQHVELVFDGAMAEPVVWVNGQKAGEWKYGYNAFRVDITPFLKEGYMETNPICHLMEPCKQANIVVSLQNLEESSRWYPGAGLYRPVTVVETDSTYIDDWGVVARTVSIHQGKNDAAMVKVEVPVKNRVAGTMVNLRLLDAEGKELTALYDAPVTDDVAAAVFVIPHARLWTPETPYLYKVEASVRKGSTEVDSKRLRIGVRTVSVSKEGGFQLNGISRKIQGVCLHHDLGPLGAAVDKDALTRQIRILKDMGCDAIRTAHNMPSAMQMELCDSLGMMVMAESFDMWIYPKCKNGYARFFQEWADRDIANLVMNHRNHPSIVMWSIGNEIPEQWDAKEGVYWSKRLQDLIHRLDPTRPVTQGMDRADEALSSGFAQVMDVPGFNYRVHKYDRNIEQLPVGFLLGSETASTVSSRGVYKFPVELSDNSQFASYSPNYDPTALQKADGQCSSYDVEWCPWSNLPDDDFLMMDDRTWTIGQFVWTGFDYLGEPTPYDEYWPSRSSYFGICDLAGLPKDRFYLYRSQWNKRDHTLHILPHWTWPGREGEVTPVYVYTDYPEAELFVNGKSQGRRKKDMTASVLVCNPDAKETDDRLLDRYRLRWNDVVYEPGEVRVVAYDEMGNKVAETSKQTAGAPAGFSFSNQPVAREFVAGMAVSQGKAAKKKKKKSKFYAEAPEGSVILPVEGRGLAFVVVQMVDEKGHPVPTCQDELDIEVEGGGCFKAVCNGDATSLEPFTEPRMRLFNGQLVVVVQVNRPLHVTTLRVTDRERGIVSEVVLQYPG